MNPIMNDLKNQLKIISDLILDKNDVLYFDFPLHLNVGDLLIYVGTEQFFLDYNISVKLRRAIETFDTQEIFEYVTPRTTILCHGGGNFGDLYPDQQRLREVLVKNFPNNTIIVLPQTAHFTNQEELQKSAKIFQQHKNCYLFARDLTTQQIMQAFSDKVILSPDMAHQLYGILKPSDSINKKSKTLYFLRKDIEATGIERRIMDKVTLQDEVSDWQDVTTFAQLNVMRVCLRLARLANKMQLPWLKNIVNKIWFTQANSIINMCVDYFSSFDNVVTSRLHGHIFSCLLDLNNQVCDNSYGKNFAYYELWTKPISFVNKYEFK